MSLQQLSRTSFDVHASLAQKLPDYGYRRVDVFSVTEQRVCHNEPGDRDPKCTSSWVNGPGIRDLRQMDTKENCAQVHPRQYTRTLLTEAVKRCVFMAFIHTLVFRLHALHPHAHLAHMCDFSANG